MCDQQDRSPVVPLFCQKPQAGARQADLSLELISHLENPRQAQAAAPSLTLPLGLQKH